MHLFSILRHTSSSSLSSSRLSWSHTPLCHHKVVKVYVSLLVTCSIQVHNNSRRRRWRSTKCLETELNSPSLDVPLCGLLIIWFQPPAPSYHNNIPFWFSSPLLHTSDECHLMFIDSPFTCLFHTICYCSMQIANGARVTSRRVAWVSVGVYM